VANDGTVDSNVATVSVTVTAPATATSTAMTTSAATSAFGQTVTLTATVSPAPGNGTVEFFDNGTSLGTATVSGGTAALPTNGIQAGTRSLTAVYSGNSAFAGSTSTAITQTVSKAATTGTFAMTPFSQFYSDRVTFKATLSPATLGGRAPATSVRFKVGTQVMGTAPLVLNPTTGVLEANLDAPLVETVDLQMRPGSKLAVAEFLDVDPSFTVSNRTASLAIKQEEALTAYKGQSSVSTGCATCTTTTVRLEALVTEVADGNPGDVRKATMIFVNRATGLAIGTGILDSTKSTATEAYYYFNWSVNLGTSPSQTFTIGMAAGTYYLRNNVADNGTVTVTKQP
jgi:hypothetical protein